MSQYYRRQFELFVGDGNAPFIAATNDRQFRITFNVVIDYGAFNSYADIAIYNLSRDTEGKVFKRGQPVEFRAGYEDTIDVIFKGEIRNIFREKFGADRVTRVVCRSSDKAVTSAVVNQSFPEDTDVPAIIKACSDSMELGLEIVNSDFSEEPTYDGYTLSADPKFALNDLSKRHNFDWLIDNGQLVVTGQKAFRAGSPVEISALTGMVGSPEITEIGCDVIIKLNPKARIGSPFKINSEFPQANFSNVYFQDILETIGTGEYKIQRVEHSGDSYGDEWETKLIGIGDIQVGA